LSTAIASTRTHYYSVNDNGTQEANYNNDGATGINALAAGTAALASGVSSVAVGDGASATADGALALGQATTASVSNGVAIGNGASVSIANSVALGAGSTVSSAGVPVSSVSLGSMTLGGFAGASPVGVVSFGAPGAERQLTNVAAGQISSTSTDAINGSQLFSVASQLSTSLGQISSLSTGLSTTNSNLNSLSTSTSTGVGSLSTSVSTGISSLSTGLSTTASTLSPGNPNHNENGGSVATQGRGFNNTATTTVDPSSCGSANGVDTTASGTCAQAGTIAGVNGATKTTVANGATAIGSQSLAQDTNTTAIGFRATAQHDGSVAIGYQAQAIADPATAIGSNSLASGNNSVALGASAQATASGSVALGAGSVADQDNTVSVGSPGNERRITNVAPGVNPTDAVNMQQLQSVQSNVNDVARHAYSGIAMAMAMSGTYLPTLNPGEQTLGVGTGEYQGYGALAITFKGLSGNGRWGYGAGIATTGRDVGVNAGVGWKW
jgi:trimeric autotransporter adhesin